jgi:collagenase-like PrtC family protease
MDVVQRIELLAPAKNLDCGQVAIQCGADAVYLGANRFGAREGASNSLGDVEALARYAHRYWAKVYVTLNTILHDAEIPQAVRLAREMYAAGVDGLIIQDMGLLECDLPPLPLIASTQMHNHTPERVAFLEQAGFQRAILARELSLQEIQQIGVFCAWRVVRLLQRPVLHELCGGEAKRQSRPMCPALPEKI